MSGEERVARRSFIKSGLSVGVGTVLISPNVWAKEKEEAEVGPAEDLMREHGVLNRILLVYEEGIRRLQAKSSNADLEVLKKSASLIKRFIENYHEKLEEEFIFPRMRKAGRLVDLVDILEAQHKGGRRLTSHIEQLAIPATLKDEGATGKLVDALKTFITMYRPHESREDTVLFPMFHEMLGKKEYEKLGEQFEEREHKLFGKAGFEEVVAHVSEFEKAYGIHDLAKFTP